MSADRTDTGEKIAQLAEKLSHLADEAMKTGETMSPTDIKSLSSALVNLGKLCGEENRAGEDRIEVVFVGNDWDVR